MEISNIKPYLINNISADNNINCRKNILPKDIKDSVSFKAINKKPFTNLSQYKDIRVDGKQFRIESLPKGMNYNNGKFTLEEKIPTVAIVDVFSDSSTVSIGSGKKINHGDIVTKYAVNGFEDKIGVLAFDVTPPKDGDEYISVAQALEQVANIQNEFNNISALNLSVGYLVKYDKLSKDMGITINAENVVQYKEQIINFLKSQNELLYKGAYESILSINKMVDSTDEKKPISIFSASGNLENSGFDLLSLSNAQYIVSADDYKYSTSAFSNLTNSGKHTFVNNYNEKGNLESISDGIISYSAKELELENKTKGLLSFIKNKKDICGTSFACPIALNSKLGDILKKHNN